MKTFGSCHPIINRNSTMIIGTPVVLQMLVLSVERYLYSNV